MRYFVIKFLVTTDKLLVLFFDSPQILIFLN